MFSSSTSAALRFRNSALLRICLKTKLHSKISIEIGEGVNNVEANVVSSGQRNVQKHICNARKARVRILTILKCGKCLSE